MHSLLRSLPLWSGKRSAGLSGGARGRLRIQYDLQQSFQQSSQQAVQHRRDDVLVGVANFWATAFHVAPAVMKPLVRRMFGMSDR
ncbi:hypothetical protein H6F43_17140 [Leptolyngbya sp. FACHB-36]|uniref:hypothetical protein n=1 Tax=Leptolyngbya sp. FACHB-36 TaxID=2692808 RepID=UPI0016811333|nr:hypothetical protein [Leptolyngbya sp. FACHB-36]MBD2021908.1 hypothetical protein [Leptolyngbya sp. FACHB-36]